MRPQNGIGTDYGIYYLFRYEGEIFLGRSLQEALERTAARAGPGMLIGALIAAATFFVLTLTAFRGIQELGFIAGISILLAWLGMMTFFPALLVFMDGSGLPKEGTRRDQAALRRGGRRGQRWRETLLALLPLVLGMLWTIGLMKVFGIQFNLANIWGLPLIIGTSAEFGLNVMFRYLEGRSHGGRLVARSTVMAVTLSGIQTMVGFGSLMIASHR